MSGRHLGRQRSNRFPAGVRLLAIAMGAITLLGAAAFQVDDLGAPPDESPAAEPLWGPAPLHRLAAEPGAPGPDGNPERRILVLYNATGASAELSKTEAIQAANLASRGGAWTIRPVEEYRAGDLDNQDAAIYVARYSDVPLPRPFLADVGLGRVPVLWMGDNISQLFAAEPDAVAGYGWRPTGIDPAEVHAVDYRGQQLERRADEPTTGIELDPGGAATSLGTALHDDGGQHPWAVAADNLTYVGEVPFSYVDTRDRYLAAADLIQRLVAPDAPERRRALIRIEDVGPNTDPDQIREIADLLYARGVPFSLATYPYYRDPNGTAHDGEPASFRLVDVPELTAALRYAQDHGATIVMHGYSHQYESVANPYDGTSGGDFEFYAAHVDDANSVQLDGPVPADSPRWAAERLAIGRAEFVRAGLGDPAIFEFPHYTGSAASYQAVHQAFGVRYDQGTYFASQCPGNVCSASDVLTSTGLFQQYFPYPVRDVYGSVVIPENLGNISEPYNNNEARTPQDLIDAAQALTVVRDGVASAFFHPFLPLSQLETVIDGIEGHGFRFVTPHDILGVDDE